MSAERVANACCWRKTRADLAGTVSAAVAARVSWLAVRKRVVVVVGFGVWSVIAPGHWRRRYYKSKKRCSTTIATELCSSSREWQLYFILIYCALNLHPLPRLPFFATAATRAHLPSPLVKRSIAAVFLPSAKSRACKSLQV